MAEEMEGPPVPEQGPGPEAGNNVNNNSLPVAEPVEEEAAVAAEEVRAARPVERFALTPKARDVFRGLWASLFYSGRAGGKTVLICSADRGEGASTVAAALALSGSQPEGVDRVALVDLNLRHPHLHRLFHLKAAPGVREVIANGHPVDRAAQSVTTGLDFYAGGSVGDRILEVLRSEALNRFVEALSARYDRILIDAAPVNHFPDAQVLAGVAKDVVLVSHTHRTPREAVAQAKKQLEAGGGRLAGLVLNRRTYPIPRFLYRRV
jgi:tyrosine-protein kinase Etk/Wzc